MADFPRFEKVLSAVQKRKILSKLADRNFFVNPFREDQTCKWLRIKTQSRGTTAYIAHSRWSWLVSSNVFFQLFSENRLKNNFFVGCVDFESNVRHENFSNDPTFFRGSQLQPKDYRKAWRKKIYRFKFKIFKSFVWLFCSKETETFFGCFCHVLRRCCQQCKNGTFCQN